MVDKDQKSVYDRSVLPVKAGSEGRSAHRRPSLLPVSQIEALILEHAPDDRLTKMAAHALWTSIKLLGDMGFDYDQFHEIMEATWRRNTAHDAEQSCNKGIARDVDIVPEIDKHACRGQEIYITVSNTYWYTNT